MIDEGADEEFWLGIHEEEGDWKWLDGTPYSWHNWKSQDDNENCARILDEDSRKWGDTRCDDSGNTFQFICEKVRLSIRRVYSSCYTVVGSSSISIAAAAATLLIL